MRGEAGSQPITDNLVLSDCSHIRKVRKKNFFRHTQCIFIASFFLPFVQIRYKVPQAFYVLYICHTWWYHNISKAVIILWRTFPLTGTGRKHQGLHSCMYGSFDLKNYSMLDGQSNYYKLVTKNVMSHSFSS